MAEGARPWMARRLVLALALLGALAVASPLAAGEPAGMGVVFLHGKGVWPGAFDGGIPAALEAEGRHGGVSPEMPWSFVRMYGATYDEAMARDRCRGRRPQGAGARPASSSSATASAPMPRSAMRRGAAASRGGGDFARPSAGNRGNARPHRRRDRRGAAAAGRGRPDAACLAGHDSRRADLRHGVAVGLSQHVRSERARRDSEKCRGAARRAAAVGGRQFRSRSIRAAANTRFRAAPKPGKAAISRSRPAI